MFKLLVIYITLITCAPGTPLYTRYGHTAIRVTDTEMRYDLTFNYGTFCFADKNFYWNFVKGETYYELTQEPFRDFLYEYMRDNRRINHQILNLDYQQSMSIVEAIYNNQVNENERRYLYNFVFDNCATRPYQLIKKTLGDSISSTYKGIEGETFRQAITRYTGKGSWECFGINMVFGRKADRAMTIEERMFLPEELMNYLREATFPSGRPVVGKDNCMPFEIAKVPWYKTCYLGIALFALLLVALSIFDRKRGKLTIGVDIALGIIYLLLISLVIFLTFFSLHPLVGLNWRLFLFPFIHLCARLIYFVR